MQAMQASQARAKRQRYILLHLAKGSCLALHKPKYRKNAKVVLSHDAHTQNTTQRSTNPVLHIATGMQYKVFCDRWPQGGI